MDITIEGKKIIKGQISVPPDKSISHRAVMISSIADGRSVIRNFLKADDCLRTVDCFRKLGVDIQFQDNDTLIVYAKGLKSLKEPKVELYAGNSGTTMRLLLGILAGQSFECVLTGDDSLSRRPMKRVVEPLKKMGAKIDGKEDGNFAPLKIEGGKLKGIEYKLPVASAQVKSALLFAGLYADRDTVIYEKEKSRDHTEIMLKHFGADLSIDGTCVKIAPTERLNPSQITVPGDISSASFFIVSALLNRDSRLLIKDVGLNPTRTGIIDVLKKMGGKIYIENQKTQDGELVGDIYVEGSELKSVTVKGEIIPRIIDEIPILSVACAFADGTSVIKDAKELRVKESDRIRAIAFNLRKMGVKVEELEDGLIIEGNKNLKPAEFESFNDHRIAMSMAIASISLLGESKIKDIDCVSISFPSFFELLSSVSFRD